MNLIEVAHCLLPNPSDVIGVELLVSADNGDLFHDCLSKRQPIKRVFVMERHSNQLCCMRGLNRQHHKAILHKCDVQKRFVGTVQLPFVDADFDGNLPVRTSRHVLRKVFQVIVIVRNDGDYSLAKSGNTRCSQRCSFPL